LSSVSFESFISATVFWIWGQGSDFVRRGVVRSRTQFSQWWIWVLELFFVSRWISATVTLFHRRVLVRLLGLLAAAINLLRVAGHSSVFGFVDFGPSFPLVLPTGQIVFLWLAVACSLVLSCRKTVPLVSLPAGRCASRSSVSVAVRVVWSLWE
jgi:hypothetical protein